MRSNEPRRGWRVGLGLAVATAIAALGSVGTASAAPLVNPDALGSITVHKFEAPVTPTGDYSDGTIKDTTGLTPLPGVDFTVAQVNTIDLSTNAGWTEAASIPFDPANPENSLTDAGYTLGTASTVTTDVNGEAYFGELPVGVYLVQETSYPAGVTPSAPFIITVPLTNPDSSDTWMYDVHVYPKNATTTATKTVVDADSIKLGDPVQWTIKGDIPNVDPIDGYKVVDALDPRLDYVSTAVSLSNGAVITEDIDYSIDFDAVSNTVTVLFTDAGRAILAQNPDAQVVVVIDTTVNTIGEIPNTALVYPNAGSFDVQPGEPGGPTPTNEVATKWGEITVLKHGENGITDALGGAQFMVFTSAADAATLTNPVVIDNVDTWTSAADGTLTISGLRYSGFANGVTVAPGEAGYNQYYLVEVVAPDGYELLAEPIQFVIDASTTAVGIDLYVENVPSNAGFELPMTGGTGTTVLYLVGLAMLAGGAVFLIAQRRRQHS